MATRSQLNISTTYYESFLALSLSVRVGKRQLKMETSRGNQLPVLKYRDVFFTSEYLKDSLSAVCPLMGVHNVARVRQGALPLFEVDFIEKKALDKFCRSLSNGMIQKRLQNKFKEKCGWEIEVMLKLHLILPNAEKKKPSSREVTTDNYQECFSLMKESALFEFGALNIGHDLIADEELIQQDLDIGDLSELLQDLNEMAASWFTVGLLLKISYSKLEIIRRDNRDQSDCLREMLATWLKSGEASAADIVHSLRSSGRSVLAKKMAVKHGVTIVTTADPEMIEGLEPQDAKIAEKFFTQFAQDSRTQPVAILRALANQSDEIAFKDTHNSDLNDKLDGLKEEEKRVYKALQDAKLSLSSVQVQINELKSEQDILIKKRENKRSSMRWLQRQKSVEELAQINQMINDIEEAVSELSTQIDELEEKITAQNKQVKQMSGQLILKEKEKEQLLTEMDKILKEKHSELEEDRRLFENEMQRMVFELESSESKHVAQMSTERLLIDKEKELLERKIQDEKTDFEIKLQRSFENEMKYMYELKLHENKMEMMRDKLAHKRKLELASAQAAMMVPAPFKPMSYVQGGADAAQVALSSDDQTFNEPPSAVQSGERIIGEEQLSYPLTMSEIIHAYDVSLRASKEREQELQSQVDALQYQSIVKEQKLSKLEKNDSDMRKKMLILMNDYDKQQEVLEKLQQKAVKAKLSVEVAVQVNELVGYELEALIPHGFSMTGGKYQAKLAVDGTQLQPFDDHSYVKIYQEEVKQLQQELEQRQRMVRARDVIILNLEQEKNQIQNKLDLQEASYQQLLSEKKEMQLLRSEDWVIALQAASSTFSEQNQQRLFDVLKAIRLQSGPTVDTAVQADYLAVAPDFLRGVEVCGETVLEVVGDKPQKLKWPGYGFYIEVPDGTLPPGVTASVGVKIILKGQFKLPENSQLISAVYWISSSEVFLKEVAVNIQHCAVIRSEEQCSNCKFIIAKCSQEILPYRFKVKEGLFNAHTQYATIKLKQFSLVGATGPEDTELRYLGLKFYKPIPHTVRVDFIFVVIRNLEAELKSVTNVYSDYKEDKQTQMIVFENDEITLDLPCDPTELIVVNDSWKLLPLTCPKIAKVDVEQFQAGTRPPTCNIELEWTGKGEQQELSHRVKIIGAKEPNNYFQMRYYPHAMDTPAATSVQSEMAHSNSPPVTRGALDKPPNILNLLNKVACKARDKWEMMGLALGMELNQLNSFSKQYDADPIKCYTEVFSTWKKNTDPPFTWATVINSLKLPIVGETKLATEIEEWLSGLDK